MTLERKYDATPLVVGADSVQDIILTPRNPADAFLPSRSYGVENFAAEVSDSHGVRRGQLFGWYYTLTFARTSSLEDLKESITNHYSVAIEALPGEFPRVHGPFRLVKLAQFLIRELYPLRDALCAEEGRWMLAHVTGHPAAAENIVALRGQADGLVSRLWARP